MTTKTQEQVEKGCLYQETYSKNSFCKKGNLCSECSLQLKVLQEQEFELKKIYETNLIIALDIKEQELLKEFEDVINEVRKGINKLIIPSDNLIKLDIHDIIDKALKNLSPQTKQPIVEDLLNSTDYSLSDGKPDKIEDSLRGKGLMGTDVPIPQTLTSSRLCKCGHESSWHDMKYNQECRVDVADDPDIKCDCSKFVEVRE